MPEYDKDIAKQYRKEWRRSLGTRKRDYFLEMSWPRKRFALPFLWLGFFVSIGYYNGNLPLEYFSQENAGERAVRLAREHFARNPEIVNQQMDRITASQPFSSDPEAFRKSAEQEMKAQGLDPNALQARGEEDWYDAVIRNSAGLIKSEQASFGAIKIEFDAVRLWQADRAKISAKGLHASDNARRLVAWSDTGSPLLANGEELLPPTGRSCPWPVISAALDGVSRWRGVEIRTQNGGTSTGEGFATTIEFPAPPEIAWIRLTRLDEGRVRVDMSVKPDEESGIRVFAGDASDWSTALTSQPYSKPDAYGRLSFEIDAPEALFIARSVRDQQANDSVFVSVTTTRATVVALHLDDEQVNRIAFEPNGVSSRSRTATAGRYPPLSPKGTGSVWTAITRPDSPDRALFVPDIIPVGWHPSLPVLIANRMQRIGYQVLRPIAVHVPDEAFTPGRPGLKVVGADAGASGYSATVDWEGDIALFTGAGTPGGGSTVYIDISKAFPSLFD